MRVLRDSKKSYYSTLISNAVSPSYLWKAIKSTLPTSSPAFDSFHRDAAGLANDFNQYFVSVSSSVSSSPAVDPPSPGCSSPSVSSHLDLQPISSEVCLELIASLQSGKATGPDNIPPGILKSVAPVVAPPLTDIINSSLSSGCFPQQWKCASVRPLHKGGTKSVLTNYRPISILPTCSKLIEMTVRSQLVAHLEDNNLLYPLQSGFRRRHSTASTLLRATNDWYRALDTHLMIGVLFLDVSKAFDTVDHSLLLSKLQSYGVSVSTLMWFKSYLSGRSQFTKIGDVKSHPLSVTAGVPQGSILGPNLFSVHINDLPSICPVNSTAVLFADDTTIYVIGSSASEISSILSLALENCPSWMDKNKLKLNTSKTKCMLIHSSRRSPPPLTVALGATPIEQVRTFKFLGCIINDHLTWDDHVTYLSSKVSRNINLLRRLSWFLPRRVLMTFYSAYILPSFDYCDVVWHSCSAKLVTKLESLQNYAGRIILKKRRFCSATAVRKTLGWSTLQSRRELHTAIQAFKSLNGMDPGYLAPLLTPSSSIHNHRTRASTTDLLHLPQVSTNFGKKSFAFRAASVWNALPAETRQLKSLHAFKTSAYSCIVK